MRKEFRRQSQQALWSEMTTSLTRTTPMLTLTALDLALVCLRTKSTFLPNKFPGTTLATSVSASEETSSACSRAVRPQYLAALRRSSLASAVPGTSVQSRWAYTTWQSTSSTKRTYPASHPGSPGDRRRVLRSQMKLTMKRSTAARCRESSMKWAQ